jgi:CCR4-NOT transcription complex subunit 1
VTNTPDHSDISTTFLATIVDRFIQEHPPNFDHQAQTSLWQAISIRYSNQQEETPTEVLSALYLMTSLSDSNPLALSIQRVGSPFTSDEETCRSYLRSLGNIKLDEEQTAAALIYAAISRTPSFSPTVLVNAVRQEQKDFDWQYVLKCFDQSDLRITPEQFLSLYEALRPLSADHLIDIQHMWGGTWRNTETQLSFVSAYASLTPDQLDASTIPGLEPTFTLDDVAGAEDEVRERAAEAVRHPLVSLAALSAMFHVALQAPTASDTVEAKRLFQKVVVPNLDIFLVSAFGVPKPWPDLANETVTNIFDRFLFKYDPNYDFVLESLWRKDKGWVAQRLVEAHAKMPMELPTILDHAIKHNWLKELVVMLNGFGLDLAALAHARGELDLDNWAQNHSSRTQDLAGSLLTFLNIKAQHELSFQREKQLHSVMLPVKTIAALMDILAGILTKPTNDLIVVQRACITAYPRLINYDQDFNEIVDANGRDGNSLPQDAIAKMEEHYKRMYSDDLQVRAVVEALGRYKRSRIPADQDVFACMIHGLFDEYILYNTYPLEALATTAVLFGGIIQEKLIELLPLEIGLGMILEAVRDHKPEQAMYKFGLQALLQLLTRLPEWTGFCRELVAIPHLRGTAAWDKAEEVLRHVQEEAIAKTSRSDLLNGGSLTNGNIENILAAEPNAPAFASLHVESPPFEISEEPNQDIQEKVLFALNNITVDNIELKFDELKDVMSDNHQQWFAEHLVEQRAKMQPNYHTLYMDLVKLFGKKSLWSEVLRETYASVIRMLNSESTMQSQMERTHLKNLGGWLGSLTLARDKPIKHKNVAFKQLLLEAFDTQRLIMVIPFVCKVLVQGQSSTVFKPPNPWLMDIIHLLIELYHNAELKLNLKFEIEVLCKDLKLDHKAIEPSSEIMSRAPPVEEPTDTLVPDMMDRFDDITLNGMAGGTGGGRFSPQELTSSIPDLGPLLQYPPANELVNQQRLQEIVRSAITRAVHEIISPVVERSVTIAAISTAQMIHKDFATEPDEGRVRAAAINMVKKTAGSLALVTSKEPLRASMMNYIRQLAQSEIPQGLPEGTIIMCVTSNLDLACGQVEKKAEERAVPEIEDMLEPELEARRHHRLTSPQEPYVDQGLSRWSWTIPNPYKLQPAREGLNQQQMAIYDEFARQPRVSSVGATTHIASSSDATRSMANEILQDSYPAVPNLATPAEPPAMPHLNTQQPAYGQQTSALANGRVSVPQVDPRSLMDRVQKTLLELQRVATEAPEQHYLDLPRPHPVLDVLDALYSMIIRSAHGPEGYDLVIVDHIYQTLFNCNDDQLTIESLVYVLQNVRRIGGRPASRVNVLIGHQPGETMLCVPLITSLIKADMIEWQRIDLAIATAVQQRKEGILEFFSLLIDNVLLTDRPIALFADFAKSLEVAWRWILEDPSMEIGQNLKQKLTSSGLPQDISRSTDDRLAARQDQMEYLFEEWVRLCNNQNANEKATSIFIAQMFNKQIINSQDDLCLFLRLSIDASVDRFETQAQSNGSVSDMYLPIDSLARLIAMLVVGHEREGEVKGDKAAFLKAILSLIVLVLNHHHVMRGENFNQKVFFRLFATILYEFNSFTDELTETERAEVVLIFAQIFLDLRPSHFPGFMFGWLGLISHRGFLPLLMEIPDDAGWEPYSKIMDTLMFYLGELLKPQAVSTVTQTAYQGVVKLLVVLQHDYPAFLAANHSKLCANIPSHCIYLHNLILNANPSSSSKRADMLEPGLKVDRLDDIRDPPENKDDVEAPLRSTGLIDVLEQALRDGPGEDAVAVIAHEIQKKRSRDTGYGYLPITVDLKLIESIVIYIGMHAIARGTQKGGPSYIQGASDVVLFSMLAHELHPEARYYLLTSIVDQLRFPNSHTHYFSQVILDIWGIDPNDPEETDIRQQITRVLLGRLIGHWPQPWGLILTCVELVKNNKYNFFDLPFIKAAPEVR